MNSFAKYMFQGMFSWMRDAVRHLTDGSILDSWLAEHWLTTVIFLMVIGVVADYAVWLFRWRPDLVWRSRAAQPGALFNHEERQMRRFRKGYDQENADIGAVAQPLTDAPVPEDVLAYRQAVPAEAAAAEDAYIDWQFAEVSGGVQTEAAPTRHRRSDRYRNANKPLRERPRRLGLTSDEEELYNGLPVTVSKEEAFRSPVFPREAEQQRKS